MSLVVMFTILMAVLAVADVFTFAIKRHRNFRYTLVGAGVLGGILSMMDSISKILGANLMGMDYNMAILQAIKTALYYPSVAVTLVVALGIIYKINRNGVEGIVEVVRRLEDISKSFDSSLAQSNENQKIANRELSDRINEGLFKIEVALNLFMKNMITNANKEMIGSLDKLVKNFNDKMFAQFGENFVKLDSSIAKLLEWQIGYKNAIEASQKAIESSVHVVSSLDKTVNALSSKNSELAHFYEGLGNLIDVYNKENEVIMENLNLFAQVGDRAKDSVSNIDSFLSSLNTNLIASNENMLEVSGNMMKSIENQNRNFIDSLSELTRKTVDSVSITFGDISSAIDAEFKQLCDSLKHKNTDMSEHFITDDTTLTTMPKLVHFKLIYLLLLQFYILENSLLATEIVPQIRWLGR